MQASATFSIYTNQRDEYLSAIQDGWKVFNIKNCDVVHKGDNRMSYTFLFEDGESQTYEFIESPFGTYSSEDSQTDVNNFFVMMQELTERMTDEEGKAALRQQNEMFKLVFGVAYGNTTTENKLEVMDFLMKDLPAEQQEEIMSKIMEDMEKVEHS